MMGWRHVLWKPLLFGILGMACGPMAFAESPTSLEISEGKSLTGLPGWVTALAYSPDGTLLAAGAQGQVQLIDVQTGQVAQKIALGSGQIRGLAFNSTGSELLVGGYQKVFEYSTTGELRKTWSGLRGQVTSLTVNPSGDRFAVGCDDETASVWSFTGDQPVFRQTFANEPVNAVAFSPDGQQLAVGLGDETRVNRPGKTVVLKAADGTKLLEMADHEQPVTSVLFSADGKLLFSGSLDEKVTVYEMPSGQPKGFFGGHGRPVNGLAWLPQTNAVVSVSGGKFAGGQNTKVWLPADGTELATLEGHSNRISSVAVSAAGQQFATGGYDGTVILWQVPTAASNAVAAAETASVEKDKEAEPKIIRIGVIGLDTSHAPAFAKLLNDPKADADVAHCRVVAAYPKGSPDIESSTKRVPEYIEQFKKLDIEIVDSIPALLEKVDCVLLETNDGRPHLEQVLPVLKAGKPCFIDKPIAGSLADAIAIFELAKHYKTPIFSSSSLRFVPGAQAIRAGKIGKVLGCDAYSPASLEATHPDLFWYGIHGVELLFTTMGPGCESVTRVQTPGIELVTGQWSEGRVGTFRGIRTGKSGYGGTAFGEKGIEQLGTYAGYRPLVVEIVKMFRTGVSPIDEQETLEIYAFMEAADESKRQGGVPVKLSTVMEKAKAEAAKKIEAGKK